MSSDNFAEELSWCITQLELGLLHQSPDSKKVTETVKVLKILKSSKAPLVKKRQAMRNALGDYRKKMKDAGAKTLAGLRHSKFKAMDRIKVLNKSKFFKPSHSKQSRNVNIQLSTTLTNLNLSHSRPTYAAAEPLHSHSSCNTSLDKRQSLFTFVPSDNSFSFGFEPEPECMKKESEDLVKKEDEENSVQSVNNVYTFQSSSSCNTSLDKRQSLFKFVPSDNCFSFGFESEPTCMKESEDLVKKEDEENTAHSVNVNNVYTSQSFSNEFAFNFS